MALSMHVDPFAVEDPSELPDWRLPLSFMKSRHTEKIKGDELSEDSWRMKDRVRRVEGGNGGEEVVLVPQIWVYSYFRYHTMTSLSFCCNDSDIILCSCCSVILSLPPPR